MLAIFGEMVCSMAFIFGFLYRLAMLPMIFTMCILQCHSERLCLEESPTKRAHCMRSLTLVRDDITITLNKTERSEEFSTK